MRRGQTFELNGRKYKVAYVNASRAHCVATVTSTFTVTGKDGEAKTIARTSQHGIDISPDTPLELLSQVQKGGRS